MSALLQVEDLKVHFPVPRTPGEWLMRARKRYVRAVDGVSFAIQQGEVVALVGESGCGKSTVGKALVSLVPASSGRILHAGQDIQLHGDHQALRKSIQYIFQDPYSSLNPRMTVRTILSRPLKIFKLCDTQPEIGERVTQLLGQVGLTAEQSLRFPHEFSGGQKQRISIARALAVQPDLIIADEPTAALDVSIQAQILKLLIELKERLGLTLLFISHDLGVVEYISDRILVMYLGTIVETGPTRKVIANPLHPYTRALISAVPKNPLQRQEDVLRLKGNIPGAIDIPPACRLHPRCPWATRDCTTEEVQLREVSSGRKVACIRIQNQESLAALHSRR